MRISLGALFFAVLTLGCSTGKSSSDAGPPVSAAAASAPAVPVPSLLPSPPPSSSGSYEDETSTRPLELLKFQFTSAVEDRAPTDKLVAAHPGDRVFAYLTLRNRSGRPRKVHLAFSINGEKRTEIDLDVAESWSFRTWGYNTVLRKDKPGKLKLEVVDDEGQPVTDQELPILAK